MIKYFIWSLLAIWPFFVAQVNTNHLFLVNVGCESSIKQNCTYFQQPGASYNQVGFCTAKIGRVNHDICQLRLDFEEFDIRGPDSEGVNFIKGTCAYDSMTLSDTAYPQPTICGKNTGSHSEYDTLK